MSISPRWSVPSLFVLALAASAATPPPPPTAADRMFAEYFRAETERVHAGSLAGIATLDDWTSHRSQFRAELLEMLGLSPLPEKTDLHATITGRVDHPEF